MMQFTFDIWKTYTVTGQQYKITQVKVTGTSYAMASIAIKSVIKELEEEQKTDTSVPIKYDYSLGLPIMEE